MHKNTCAPTTAHENSVQNGFVSQRSIVTVFAIAQHFETAECDWQGNIVRPSSLISTKLTVLNGNFIDKSGGNLFSRCLGHVVRIVGIILFIACAVPLID